MYNVMLLDDEPWELMGLQSMFPWNEFGFQIVYALDNPVTAKEILSREPVDVLFTDIRMPEINGIQLIEMLRTEKKDLSIVLLSGHAEFDYAQKALGLAVFDYLLKPLQLKDFECVAKKLYLHLEEEEKKRSLAYFEKFFFGDVRLFDIFSVNRAFFRAIISETSLDIDGFEVIKLNVASKYIFFIGSDEPISFSYFNQFENIHLGISAEVNNKNLPVSKLYQSAESAYYDFFISLEKKAVEYSNTTTYMGDLISQIKGAFDAENLVELKFLIDSIPEIARQQKCSIENIMDLWNSIITYCIHDSDVLIEYYFSGIGELAQIYINVDNMSKKLFDLLSEMIQSNNRQYYIDEKKSIYDSMEKYVYDNYAKDISLSDVCSYSETNLTYACKFFKQYAGMSFSKFLTNIRLSKACELLLNTTKSIEEICFEVGYSDYFYFCKVFKKAFNKTPYQFRRNPKVL